MNILARFLPYFIDAFAQLATKKGWKDKNVIFAALLLILAGVQAILPDLTATLGAYGPAVSSAVAFLILVFRSIDGKSPESPPNLTDKS